MMNVDRLFYHILIPPLLLVACTQKKADDEENKPRSKAVVAVQTGVVTVGNAEVVVTATGKTDAIRKEKIVSPVAGKIVSLKVLEGSEVRSGQVVATIQTKESQAALVGAEALLQGATTPEQKAETERMLELARQSQTNVNVRSKLSGVVAARSVSEGELVPENAELLTLIDLSTIVFVADIPLRDVTGMRKGQSCQVRFQSLPGTDLNATLDAISPQTDIQSQTVKVRLRFSALPSHVKTTLKTDMVGTARIITGVRKRVMLVPKSALLRNDETNTFSVMAVVGDSFAKTVSVTVGALTDSSAEVQSDFLQEGMKVITVGNYALADSTKVLVTPRFVQ
jgi:multidrug efflux pump subunit AcrA (membrane-fusion protein)